MTAFLDEVKDFFELFLIGFGEVGFCHGLGCGVLMEIRSDQGAIGAGGEPFDPFVVEPFGFLVVEPGAALMDAVHVEAFDQLFHREKLLSRTVIPAEEGEQINKGLREEAGFAETGGGFAGFGVGPVHREDGEAKAVAVAFAELAVPVRFQDQREVRPLGHLVDPEKIGPKEDMDGGAGQPFFAAKGVADVHQVIVDDNREMVGRHAIGLEQHFVINAIGGEDDFPADHIGETDCLVGFHPDADGIGGAGGEQALGLIGREVERVAHFAAQVKVVLRGGILGRLIFHPHRVEFPGCIESIVGVALVDQLAGVFFIDAKGFPFALAVGAVGAALVGALIGFEAAPGEGIEDILFGAGYVAGLVGVFDPEDEVAAVAAGKEVVVKDGSYAPQVKAAGGAGCKAKTNLTGHRMQRYGNVEMVC